MSSAQQPRFQAAIVGFFAELRRRRVLKIGGAYIAGAWLGAEILTFLLEQFQAPDWTYRFAAIVLVVGFPLTMVLAWIVQVQEDGSWAVDPERGDHRMIAAATVLGVIITAGLSWLIVPERQPEPVYEPLPNSLAVLPFVGADTLYRSLMAGLEQSGELTIVRLAPSEQTDDLSTFGRSLGVKAVASGRLVPSADRPQIEVQLLNVVPDEVVWTQTFGWDAAGIVESGNMIANGVLEAMALPPLSRREFTGTNNAEAYMAFLSGTEFASASDGGSLDKAIAVFQDAIDSDPEFARAYVSLAEAIYEWLEETDATDEERQVVEKRAGTAVDIAHRLDRNSAGAISLMGLTASNRQLRIQAFERALELDPDHDLSYYRYARQMKEDGNLEEAERLITRAITLRPMSVEYRTELAGILERQGLTEEAQTERETAHSLDLLEREK